MPEKEIAATEPATPPQLSADERNQLLLLQRNYLQAQLQFERIATQLNQAYQSTTQRYGCLLNQDTLELIRAEK